MMRIRIAIVLTLALGLLATTSRAQAGDEKARAEELLAQARAALGGDAKLKAVQSLSVAGQMRQVVGGDGDEQIQGEIQFDFLLPDKYLRTETTMVGDGLTEITRISGINGEQAFLDAHASGGGGGMVIIRPGPSDPKSLATQSRALRKEFARQLFLWLLVTPATLPLEYSYAGEAEVKGGKADAIDVKGPDDFAARLFLDKQTHRPLLLSYRGPQPRMGMVRRQVSDHPDEAEKQRKAIEAQAARQADQPPPLVDIEVYLAEYRAEDGILLPHRITRSVNGQFNEEWELSKFKINPPLKADKFKK
jgi:hypothetical protein